VACARGLREQVWKKDMKNNFWLAPAAADAATLGDAVALRAERSGCDLG
jgi:hypothetical protein